MSDRNRKKHSEKRKASERVSPAEHLRRLATFPELNPNPVFEIGISGELLYLNKAMREDFPDILWDDNHPLLKGLVEIVQSQGQPHEGMLVREVEWSDHIFEQHISYVSEFKNIRVYQVNITKRKQAEQELVAYRDHLEELVEQKISQLRKANSEMVTLKEEAESANQMKSQFLAQMSHEIRTPLHGILGFIDVLSQTPMDRQQKDILKTVNNSAKTLLAIINDILDFSKIESGKLELEEIEFDPQKELESIVDLFSSNARLKEIHLYSFIDPELPDRLIGDPHRIRQVMANLLSNAIKFTASGKEITVDVRRGESIDSRCRLTFSVLDQGIGIPEEEQSKIFEAFTQADTSVTRRFGGSGLGLSICHDLIKKMESELRLESKEGEGSRFFFQLDLKIPDFSEAKSKATGLESLNIGLVTAPESSSSTQRSIVEEYLRRLCCTVAVFQTLRSVEFQTDIDVLILLYTFGMADDILSIRESAFSPPIVVIADESDREELKKLKPSGMSILFSPVYGSKLCDSIIDVRFGAHRDEIHGGDSKGIPMPGGIVALVAEDNAVNQKLISLMLEAVNVSVDITANGEKAWKKYRENSYDIIFMDVSMPVLDGIGATQKILAEEKDSHRPHTPIIAMTAHAIKGDRERFISGGMDDYLAKPVEMQALKSILRAYVKKEQTDRESIYPLGAVSKAVGLEPEAVLALVDEFFQTSGERIDRLRSSLKSKDYGEMQNLAHRLKGVTANLRLESLTSVASRLNEAAASRNHEACRRLLKELIKAIKSTKIRDTARDVQ